MSKKITVVFAIVVLITFGFLVTRKSEEKMTDTNINLPVQATQGAVPSGLKIEDIQVGSGPEVKSGDTVTINYKGTLTDGTKFDSSYDRGTPFTTQIGVGQVIKGWDEGVIGMKAGGRRKLTIPSDLAYGGRDIPGIPANSILVFELELIAVK